MLPDQDAIAEHLQGLVERVTFHSPESGFCVPRIKVREIKAKQLAQRKGQTSCKVIEDRIRLALYESDCGNDKFKLRDARVEGNGSNPEFESASWSDIRDAVYEDRGH